MNFITIIFIIFLFDWISMADIDKKFMANDKMDLSKYIICTYQFQTSGSVLEAALDLCKSQSTSSAGWGESAEVKDETDEIIDEFGAKLISYRQIDISRNPDLPLVNHKQHKGGLYTRAEVKMALPIGNIGDSVPILFTAAAGEIHYLPGFISVKWTDVEFSDVYLKNFRGPKFGSSGMRQISGTDDNTPLVIAVVKPSLIHPKKFAELVYEAAIGGVHMVKEDELLVDIPASPLEERVKLAMESVKKAEEVVGRKIFYQPNITGDISNLRKNYETVVKHGVSSVMVNAMAIGLSAARYVTDFSEVPVASHFDLTACHAKVPYFGISHKVLAKMHRMVGIDNLVVPAFGDTMMEYENDIYDELEMCRNKFGDLKQTLPFLGGGVKATNVPYILSKARTNNVGLIVGHGIYGNPDGPTAGTKSVVQAVDAYKQDISLDEYAKTHKELARAIEKWGLYK